MATFKDVFSIAFVLAVALGVTAQSNTRKAQPKATRGSPSVEGKSISHYMRQIGLLYLQTEQSVMERAYRGDESPDDKVLIHMEESVAIEIHSTIDVASLSLLKRSKDAGEAGYYAKQLHGISEVSKQFNHLYTDCTITAHEIAVTGVFHAGSCTEENYNLIRELEENPVK